MDEALTFCSMYFQGVEIRFNRPDQNEDAITLGPKIQLSIFKSQCRAIGKMTFVHLDET